MRLRATTSMLCNFCSPICPIVIARWYFIRFFKSTKMISSTTTQCKCKRIRSARRQQPKSTITKDFSPYHITIIMKIMLENCFAWKMLHHRVRINPPPNTIPNDEEVENGKWKLCVKGIKRTSARHERRRWRRSSAQQTQHRQRRRRWRWQMRQRPCGNLGDINITLQRQHQRAGCWCRVTSKSYNDCNKGERQRLRLQEFTLEFIVYIKWTKNMPEKRIVTAHANGTSFTITFGENGYVTFSKLFNYTATWTWIETSTKKRIYAFIHHNV